MPTVETLYLQLHDEILAREAMEVRLKRLEDFIQGKYAGELSPSFAGDMGEIDTSADPNPVNPILIDDAAPLIGELPQPKTGLVPLEKEGAP